MRLVIDALTFTVLVAILLTAPAPAQAQRLGGVGRTLGVGEIPEPKDCGTDATRDCLLIVTPVLDPVNESCTVKVPPVPFVLQGQTIRWRLDPAVADVEFAKRRGIRIDQNIYDSASSPKKKYYECKIDPITDREFTCKRMDANVTEKARRVLSYTIFVRAGSGGDREICFVDPLIVSRD